MVQTIRVEHWDDLCHARGEQAPADVVVTMTVRVVPVTPEARGLARDVEAEWDLSEASLGLLLGDEALGPYLKVARKPSGHRSPAAAAGGGGADVRAHMKEVRDRRQEIRDFADALGRSKEYINPRWTPDKGTRNKYVYPPDTLVRDYDAWVVAGRPPLTPAAG